MKKRAVIVIIFTVLVSLVGCGRHDSDEGENHSSNRYDVSGKSDVSEGTEILADNIVTVQVDSGNCEIG